MNDATNVSAEQGSEGLLDITEVFSPWRWDKNDLPPYIDLIKRLHGSINFENQKMINRNLKPIAPFDRSNIKKREAAMSRAFSTALLSEGDDRVHKRLGRRFLNYWSFIFLYGAITYYSRGLLLALSSELDGRRTNDSGELSRSERALIYFYKANHSLQKHIRVQGDITARAEFAVINAKKAAEVRHTENRAIANDIMEWYRENHAFFPSMDAAAQAATKIVPVKFRTAQKHISAAAKKYSLRAKRTPSK